MIGSQMILNACNSLLVNAVFFVVAVISVPEQVAERLEPSDDSSGPSYIDYSERRSLPISIPDYQTVEQGGEKFVVSVNGVVNVVRFVRLRVSNTSILLFSVLR